MRALPGQKSRIPPGRPVESRQAVAVDQRRRIVRVTAELVAKRGYQDTTTELIVRRAKVGYGTFYKIFADKEACFLALFDETLARTSVVLSEAYGSVSERPWAERIAVVIESLYRLISQEPALARACIVESLTAGPVALAHYETALQELGTILRPGREQPGALPDLPSTLEGTVAGGIMWVAAQRLLMGEPSKLPDVVPEAIQFALSPYLGEEAAVAIAERHGAVAALGERV